MMPNKPDARDGLIKRVGEVVAEAGTPGGLDATIATAAARGYPHLPTGEVQSMLRLARIPQFHHDGVGTPLDILVIPAGPGRRAVCREYEHDERDRQSANGRFHFVLRGWASWRDGSLFEQRSNLNLLKRDFTVVDKEEQPIPA